ncbi:MAG: exodeoxyribonuclease VII small subunit [Ruminococcaceae bacterium]|nr:exodeoxyribonuclease VII small subunit [Oscillospiraceae bacterium]
MAEKKTFEKTMTELENVVTELENGQLELDRALSLFEKGVKLSRDCQKILDQAEQKVTKLLKTEDGEVAEETF